MQALYSLLYSDYLIKCKTHKVVLLKFSQRPAPNSVQKALWFTNRFKPDYIPTNWSQRIFGAPEGLEHDSDMFFVQTPFYWLFQRKRPAANDLQVTLVYEEMKTRPRSDPYQRSQVKRPRSDLCQFVMLKEKIAKSQKLWKPLEKKSSGLMWSCKQSKADPGSDQSVFDSHR